MRVPELKDATRAKLWWALDLPKIACELASAAEVSKQRVSQVLIEWESDGFVERSHVGVNEVWSRRYLSAEEEHAETEIAATRMWRTLRMMRAASPRDIAAHASVGRNPVTEKKASEFCRMLLKAGYLRIVETGKPGVRPPRYRLIRDTGPLPPLERRIAAVWDVNLGEFTYLPEITA